MESHVSNDTVASHGEQAVTLEECGEGQHAEVGGGAGEEALDQRWKNTPVITILAHAIYGAILGAFYRL